MCSTFRPWPRSLQNCDGLVAVHFDPLERLVFLDDLGHFGLDPGKILLGKPPLALEIVVEAVLDRGAEGQLNAVEKPHHRPGHDVGAGVPHDIQGLGVAIGNQPQGDLAFFGQEGVGADDLTIDLRGHRGLGQAGADFSGNIDGADAASVFQDLAVGQIDFKHVPQIPGEEDVRAGLAARRIGFNLSTPKLSSWREGVCAGRASLRRTPDRSLDVSG